MFSYPVGGQVFPNACLAAPCSGSEEPNPNDDNNASGIVANQVEVGTPRSKFFFL